MSAPSMPAPVTLVAATILERAVDAARDRAGVLFDGLATLDAMGSADQVEIKGEALRWLAEKFGADVREIMNDLDHAQHATVGGVYETAGARYATPDDDPRYRDLILRATGGARNLDGAGGEKQVTDRTLIGNKDSDRAQADERLRTLMRDATLQDRPLFEDQGGAEGPHTERTPDEKMTLDNSEGHSGERGGAIDPAGREGTRELASEVQTIAEVLAHLAGTDGHGYCLDPGHVGYLASRLASVGRAIEGVALGLPAEAQK